MTEVTFSIPVGQNFQLISLSMLHDKTKCVTIVTVLQWGAMFTKRTWELLNLFSSR